MNPGVNFLSVTTPEMIPALSARLASLIKSSVEFASGFSQKTLSPKRIAAVILSSLPWGGAQSK